MVDDPKSVTDSVASISKKIDEALDRIEKDAAVKEHRSLRQRRWDIFFRAATAVLAVGSPALVTYSTAAGVADVYKLAAIILSGIAGASATLQTIFALQQNYVRNAVDALDLQNVKAQLEYVREEALRKQEGHEKYADLKMALTNATKSHREIIIGRQKAYLEQNPADKG